MPDEGAIIFVGIDDTDMPGTPGTNQLGRRIGTVLPEGFRLEMLVRHQLLLDDRVPYTSQNGSASLRIRAVAGGGPADLADLLRSELRAWFVPGSDPGFCVASHVPDEVVAFGRRCKRAVITQEEARALAHQAGVLLESAGGTGGGIIGALAAVGLLAAGDDGRVVHLAGWTWPDPFSGVQPVSGVLARGVDEVRDIATESIVREGYVDVGKHLRPAYRRSRVVMYVEPAALPLPSTSSPAPAWRAVKLT